MDKQEGKHAGGIDYEFTDITKLKPAEYNPRTITDDEFSGLKESIKTFGFVDPAIINKDFTIIGGHQRIKAAEALGMTNVPCVILDLDKKQEKKLNVILNSHAISGKYDDLKLSEILEELKLDEDYESLRLNVLEPLDLSPTEVEEDEAPEVSQDPPVSKLGEIYQLGRHRVMCGDSTDKASVELLMNGVKADMVFTDPPYGMGLDADYSALEARGAFASRSGGSKYDNVIGDDKEYNPSQLLDYFSDTKEIFMWGADYYGKYLPRGGSWIVWDKRVTESLDKAVGSSFELCWSKSKHKRDIARITWAGIFGFNKSEDGSKREHPTQKPVKLVAWFFDRYEGDIVADLFLGSGSTLIACEQTDRTCYGMELDPKYVDVIRKRYWKFVNDGNEEGWQDGTTN